MIMPTLQMRPLGLREMNMTRSYSPRGPQGLAQANTSSLNKEQMKGCWLLSLSEACAWCGPGGMLPEHPCFGTSAARGSPGRAETAPRWQGFGGEGAGPQEGRGLRSGGVGEFSILRDSPAPPTGCSLLIQKLPLWAMSRCRLELGKPQSISDSPR